MRVKLSVVRTGPDRPVLPGCGPSTSPLFTKNCPVKKLAPDRLDMVKTGQTDGSSVEAGS